MDANRAPGQRAGLTPAAVLRSAREVLAERGLSGLTMRAVADDLGVAPNALYSHVESKTALIDDVLDDVLGEVLIPDRDSPGVAGLQAMMVSTYDVLLAHPGLVPGYLERQGARGVNAHRLGDSMLELLGKVGVTGPAAVGARTVLIVYAIGYAAFATTASDEAADEHASEWLRDNYVTGLGWLLAGIRSAS